MRVLGAVFSLLLIAICAVVPSPGRAQSAPRESKIGALLSQTDYKFRKHNDVTWSTPVAIGELGERKLIVSHSDDIVVVFVIVAVNKDMKKTPRLMEMLLKSNREYDYCKIGFDGDGDLFVRIDWPMDKADLASLKASIEQVRKTSIAIAASMAKLPAR